MSVRCTITGHKPAARQIYNSGYYFSACARCGRGLVRAPRGIWQTAPSGHRIVWKTGRRFHSIEADYADVLPVVVPRLALPAPPSPFASWRRDLVRLGRRASLPARNAARAIDESGEPRFPRVLLMAVMVGAGLRMLLSMGAAK